LCALKEDALAIAESVVDEERRVRDVGGEPVGVPKVRRGHLVGVERLQLVNALEPDVLLGDGELDLLAEDLRVEQILDADADPRRLVCIGRADPTPRRPDLELA
jgi:hypothetical protein